MSSNLECETDHEVIPSKAQRVATTWSDLPWELLEFIAKNYLALIDFLSFRGVCKDWKLASSRCTAEIESRDPWLLVVDKSTCILLRDSVRKYNISIPELCEAKCIGSNHGWLLLLKESSVFFFCPFSRAKIELPNFPCPETFDLVAVFSSPPTSQGCIVAIVSNRTEHEKDFKVYVLRRGFSSWTMHMMSSAIKTVIGAAYCDNDNSFYFFDAFDCLSIFSLSDQSSKTWRLVTSQDKSLETIPFSVKKNEARNFIAMASAFGNVALSSCHGTIVFICEGLSHVVCNENLHTNAYQKLQGVWIHPRFFELSPQDSTW
ncbi:hypothetical protein ACFE04_018229 [Oxalis oulophora]